MDSIFVLINFVENENMKKCLFYLVEKHEEAILEMDVRISGMSREESQDFKPWLILKNNTRGLYLIKKIREKFDPWVSLWKQTPIYPHQIPAKINEVKIWDQKLEKMKLKIT